MVVLRSNASNPSDDAREANKVKWSFVIYFPRRKKKARSELKDGHVHYNRINRIELVRYFVMKAPRGFFPPFAGPEPERA